MRGVFRNRVLRAVLKKFQPRFVPHGRVVWGGTVSDETLQGPRRRFSALGLCWPPSPEIPDVVIHDRTRRWLVLVDVAGRRGQLTAKRCESLKQMFHGSGLQLVLVNAFVSRRELQEFFIDCPWWTSAWFADEPEHMIHFDGGHGS
jgi:hypothetical protein